MNSAVHSEGSDFRGQWSPGGPAPAIRDVPGDCAPAPTASGAGADRAACHTNPFLYEPNRLNCWSRPTAPLHASVRRTLIVPD